MNNEARRATTSRLKKIAQTKQRRSDTHYVQTCSGLARIHTVYDTDGSPVRVLEQKGAYESATYLDERRYIPVFAYQKAFNHIFEAELPNNHILMIGGGGYAWPKQLLTTQPNYCLDVVEYDTAITAVAKKWFYLDRLFAEQPATAQKLSLITAEGRKFLSTTSKTYGALINDTFSGKTPALSLATIEAARLIKAHLAPGGIYATNIVSENEGMDISFLRDIVTTLKEVFAYVYIIPCEDENFALEDNYLVLASDVEQPFTETLPFDEDFLGSILHDGERCLD